ncbi:hypothetical protein BEN47_18425 [Hymenobacter lapidarius]|uniref:Uncharacterized protein n=1 Tax=Hymenobacter lapidarius TaxID=1908237 RepID=A0A1G1SV19_9BACT|nr:hypothetical protein [Hymenobacter lapidarius]OGX82471.1 hypothetical protein BEN47_18425 [Hymenobacter lapidarius]
MQLEDLRQSWLNSPEEAAPINPSQLDKLLASRPGVVEKMRRSARWETAFTAFLVLVSPFALFIAETLIFRIYGVIMTVMGLGLLYYYYRMLGMLSRMLVVEGNVRGHLQQLAAGLRALLRFYYRLTLALGPALMIFNLGYFVGMELARPGPFRWKFLLIMSGVLLGCGVLVQVLAVYGTRWYLQRLYGQHLDRLEANLAELEEVAN